MALDPQLYKTFRTSRGFNYNYYHAASTDGSKPTLLFLHGFPSSSRDWKPLIDFFQPQGYRIIAPDLLGYGGTDKPIDTDAFRMKFMTADIIEVLDAEKAENVVAIGHDWGSSLASRLANYYADRFQGFAFLSASYMPPLPDFDIDTINEQSVAVLGYACFGYWDLFTRDDADEVLRANIESFLTLGFAKDPTLWKEHLCPKGAVEKWASEGRTTEPLFNNEQLKHYVETFKKDGFASPLNWYKAFVKKLTPKDDAEIPRENYVISKPVFYGACSKDMACVPAMGRATIAQTCPNSTVIEYDVGHWVIYEEGESLSKDLKSWIDGKVLSTSS